MIKNEFKSDIRVKKRHVSWRNFLPRYSVLIVLSSGQAMITYAYIGANQAYPPLGYIAGMCGYWGIVTLIFCLVTNRQYNKTFDRPMRKLSKAAKEVAEGDFSVYLEPVHDRDNWDYVDAMFEDFNKMVKELGSIETLKSDFISNVSHEIKTPLAVVQSYATLLQDEYITYEQRKEYTNMIMNATKGLTTLVTNILKLNKIENQQLKPKAEHFDVCRQLCECAIQFEEFWESKDINFEADVEDKAVICTDEGMLEIVWNNLLSNAIKFTEHGGTVSMKQATDRNKIIVSVSDTGCGMSEDTIKHIFDKFYQGDTSHSREGNGLGLALAARVIQFIGGNIRVESEIGTGSTFTVKIPVKS